MTFRSLELLRLARLAPKCMVCQRIADGTIVAAHSNASRHGKGMGIKAGDMWFCCACADCHREIDQGAQSREAREALWETGFRNTLEWLWTSGLLQVAPNAVEPPHARSGTATRPIKKKVPKSRPIQNAGFPKGSKRPIPSRPLRS